MFVDLYVPKNCKFTSSVPMQLIPKDYKKVCLAIQDKGWMQCLVKGQFACFELRSGDRKAYLDMCKEEMMDSAIINGTVLTFRINHVPVFLNATIMFIDLQMGSLINAKPVKSAFTLIVQEGRYCTKKMLKIYDGDVNRKCK